MLNMTGEAFMRLVFGLFVLFAGYKFLAALYREWRKGMAGEYD